jgi:RNA polymerase sigma-70 factor, ECF subfamily
VARTSNVPRSSSVWNDTASSGNDREGEMAEQRVMAREGPVDRAAAFARLSGDQIDRSYSLAFALLRNAHEAEDAVQDALLRAWREWPRLRDPTRFVSWFQRILVNGCHDRLRQRARLAHVTELPDRPMQDEVPRSDERAALRQALAQLPPEQSVVVVLRYFADLTIDEIAQRTGSRSGTVKSRLHHALRALRAAYDAAARSPLEVDR